MGTSALSIWFLLFTFWRCTGGQATDERCINVASKPSHDACELFELVNTGGNVAKGIPCKGSPSDKNNCNTTGCCWYNGSCYEKPVKCYADFRIERCPRRLGWRESSIFTGYSVNGSDCFIEVIQSYLDFPERFWYSTSAYGVRILPSNKRNDSCVHWVDTTVTQDAPKTCTVNTALPDGRVEKQSGKVRANKCVLHSGPFFTPFDIGNHKACACHLDAWAEDKSESTRVSSTIRRFAENEESKSSCSRILGRLVRNSWRDRVEIVNSAEANIVVDALLNITNETNNSLKAKDAAVLLDTSKQLSKYKFYEGIENHSADLLIQSSAKFLSKIMKSVTSEQPEPQKSLSRRSSRGNMIDGTGLEAPDDIQWKVMHNLEGIAENIASLIQLPEDEPKYIVSANEEAVSLHVSIAKSENALHLTRPAKLEQMENSKGHSASAVVSDFSSYAGGDNVAVITAFYDVQGKNISQSKRRASGILAINPRTIKNEVVSGNLSLPVRFTLPASTKSCNGPSCEPLCAFSRKHTNTQGENWSDAGCHVFQWDENTTTCACDHTTHFAVLMLPSSEKSISENHTRVLEHLSIIVGSLSIAAIAATLTVFVVHRRVLLKDRMLIHLHLVIALMGGYISLLCGSLFSSENLNIPGPCFGFSMASHLFFLASFFWFLMEGVYLFYKVVMVFSNKWAEWVTRYSPFIGWGMPITIVIISTCASRVWAEGLKFYYNPERCFLQISNGMIWAFMAPALAIIAINSCILVKVVIVIFQSSLSRNSKSLEREKVSDSVKNSVKGAVLLMPILGVPWILNIFVLVGGSAGTAMAYIHVIVMGLQGVLIFFFYCVFNAEVRSAYKLSAERRKSLASLESIGKNRKRSQAPLIFSNRSSPDSIRYKNSLTVSSTGRTLTGISQLSSSSAPPSPGSRQSTLPMVEEHRL